MKKTTLLTVAIIAVTVTISCGKKTEKKQEKIKTEVVKESHESEGVLKLNNGNLWLANTETTQGISNMIALMNDFSDKENVEGYATLKENLESEFGTIITECSMIGEPHNQLHNYIIPMKPLFKRLASSDLNSCKENYNALNKHLLEYSNYFE